MGKAQCLLLLITAFGLGLLTGNMIASHDGEARRADVAPQDACAPERSRSASLRGELEREVSTEPARSVGPLAVQVVKATPTLPVAISDGGGEAARPVDAVTWRVSAIEKFVPLSEEQRGRLIRKFEAERGGSPAGEATEAESLDDILGAESARYYREQVQNAFKRAEEEALDKDIVWLSRQLRLTTEQEAQMLNTFKEIEDELEQGLIDDVGGRPGSKIDRAKAMAAEEERRQQLRTERLQGILTPDQHQAFVRLQSDSSGADLPVFHGPG